MCVKTKRPSQEMILKIRRARTMIASQQPRVLQCPYCQHKTIVVYEDTCGHVQAKCKLCGKETVYDVLSMRRLRRT